MVKRSANVSRTEVPAELSVTDAGDGGASPKLGGFDGNPLGHFGPRFWQAFRDTVAHLYTVSLPDPSEEARFTLSTRTYATPQAILMRCQGTAFTMTRGPSLIAQGADQLLILLQTDGSVDTDYAGRRARRETGDVEIVDYARPLQSVATDYGNLMIVVARESVPAALLAMEPHGPDLPARERRGAPDRRSYAGVLCAGRRPDGERSRGRDRGHRGADDRLRAHQAGGRRIGSREVEEKGCAELHRLARSAAHGRRLRPGFHAMAAPGVDRIEGIRRSGLSAGEIPV
jgi:hypothetical protein